MKSNRRIIPKPSFKLQNIIQRLKNESILYTEFLELLEKATDSLYENSELEFELLLSNGLPLEFDGDFVYRSVKDRSFYSSCVLQIPFLRIRRLIKLFFFFSIS